MYQQLFTLMLQENSKTQVNLEKINQIIDDFAHLFFSQIRNSPPRLGAMAVRKLNFKNPAAFIENFEKSRVSVLENEEKPVGNEFLMTVLLYEIFD